MGDWGIKVTKAGADITSTNARDYQYWSKFNIMKTYAYGTYEYTFPSYLEDVTITITHNLGTPKCVWFSYDGTSVNSNYRGSDWVWVINPSSIAFWVCNSDANSISFVWHEVHSGGGTSPAGKTWYFKYYIFFEDMT